MSRHTVALPLIGSTHFGATSHRLRQSTINLMVHDQALVPTAGYQSLLTLQASGEGRAVFASRLLDRLIVCVDEAVYAVSATLEATRIGTLASTSGPVFIVENGINQIVLVDGSASLYVFLPESGQFKRIPTATEDGGDFRATSIAYQDGYFMASCADSHRWRLSAPNDATRWPSDAENIGLLQTQGDQVQAVVAFQRQLWVMGESVTELWHDVGNTLFPYQRDNSMALNYGVLSRETIASEGSVLVWLGMNRQTGPALLVSTGGHPTPVTHDGFPEFLQSLQHPESATGFLVHDRGHLFYQLSFNQDNQSVLYDLATQQFFTLTDAQFNAHPARAMALFHRQNYFVSHHNAKLYAMNAAISHYDGEPIPHVRITPPYQLDSGARFQIPSVTVRLQQGASSELQRVLVSASKDGGMTFGNSMTHTLNPLGDRLNRCRFWQWGAANDIAFQFQCISSAQPQTIQPPPNDSACFQLLGAEMEVIA